MASFIPGMLACAVVCGCLVSYTLGAKSSTPDPEQRAERSSTGSTPALGEASGFRDHNHVQDWLPQFHKPEVAKSMDTVSLQMLTVLANALEVVATEVSGLKSAVNDKEATTD
jgi:hypothetical protein